MFADKVGGNDPKSSKEVKVDQVRLLAAKNVARPQVKRTSFCSWVSLEWGLKI